MAFLKSSQITGLSAKDVDVRGFTQADSINLGDRAYTEHEVLLADAYSIVGDVTVSDNLILSKLSDDGNAITITGDTTTRTISGSGSIEGATLAQTPNARLEGMTGEIGSAVTGSPTLDLSNATTFPAGHIIQTKRMTPDYTNIQQTGAGTIATNATLSITTTAGNSVFIQATIPTRLYASTGVDNVQVKHHVYHSPDNSTFTKISGTCMFYRNFDYEGNMHNYSQYDISDQLWWLDIGRATTTNYYKIYTQLLAGTFIKISGDGLYAQQMMLQEIQV